MKVVLIGSGNLAHHLGILLTRNGIKVVQVLGRSKGNSRKLARLLGCPWTTDVRQLDTRADVCLLTVGDNDIVTALPGKAFEGKVIAHCSGTVPLSSIPKRFIHAGVFWPLQTFTKSLEISQTSFPVCIEGRSEKSKRTLKRLANAIGCKAVTMSSKDRVWLHLGAVVVNNLSNHLFTLTEEMLRKKRIPFALLHPLITETASKVLKGSPKNMQTGPARRGDAVTLNKHLRLLEGDKKLQSIYRNISKSIEQTHGPLL